MSLKLTSQHAQPFNSGLVLGRGSKNQVPWGEFSILLRESLPLGVLIIDNNILIKIDGFN